jgi:hypothetical protein
MDEATEEERLKEKYWPRYREKVKEYCGLLVERLMDAYGFGDADRAAVRRHFDGLEVRHFSDEDSVAAYAHGVMGGYRTAENAYYVHPVSGYAYKLHLGEYDRDKGTRPEEELLPGFMQIGIEHEMGHFLRAAVRGQVGHPKPDEDEPAHEFIAELSKLVLKPWEGQESCQLLPEDG